MNCYLAIPTLLLAATIGLAQPGSLIGYEQIGSMEAGEIETALNIAFGMDESSIDNHLLKNAIESAQLQDFIDDLPQGAETFVGERGVKLSGGQRQRIGIARALYNNPEVLVLDEASSALDINTEGRFLKTIKSLSGYKTFIA